MITPRSQNRLVRFGSSAALVAAAVAGCSDSTEPQTATGGAGGGAGAGAADTGGSGGGEAGAGGAAAGGMAGDGGAAAGTGGDGGAAAGTGGDGGAALDGQMIFRHDTFGDEQLWTDQLGMHEVIQTSVDPTTALSAGLKVDADALPEGILDTADLTDPATTVALLELGAVVGLEATVNDGTIESLGITCALCHSIVDNSVMTGIGKRIDGPANRDLDPGFIISLSPAMSDPEVQAVLTSWGPGRYDPYWNQDGENHPVLIPPIYGLEGVALETYTGEGPISYWNNYVAVTQMGGQGSFVSSELGIDIQADPDLVTPKLPALLEYQLSLSAPEPEPDSFDEAAAAEGQALFEGKAQCATCHSGPNFTDAATTLHAADETGVDGAYAMRTTTGMYRTTPLRAVARRAPFFHDGSAETLEAVVEHYDGHLGLGLTGPERADLVEYLKSL